MADWQAELKAVTEILGILQAVDKDERMRVLKTAAAYFDIDIDADTVFTLGKRRGEKHRP